MFRNTSLARCSTGQKGASSQSHLFKYDRALQLSTPQMMFGVKPHEQAEKNKLQAPRRWQRGGTETCIASITKSASVLTSYEVSYRFADPQWLPMLSLACGNPVSLELRARHINYSLRHLVQKGHALFLVHKADHSVLHPRGLAAVSHVVTSLDASSQDRLFTHIIHEGPVDASDPDGRWDIVAISDARGLARAFARREMLWQRSRRVGAIQSQLGTFDWTILAPGDVGRTRPEEVMLLKNETEFIGPALQTRGIVSSHSIAQHEYHYVNEFEAPATCAVDAFHQAAYLNARHNKLVRGSQRETLHAVAWKTRQYFPYNPIELDLPFQVMCGPPQVYRGSDLMLVPPPSTGLPYLKAKPGADVADRDPGWKSFGAAGMAMTGDSKTFPLPTHPRIKELNEKEDREEEHDQHQQQKHKSRKSKSAATNHEEQHQHFQQKQLTLLQFDLAIKQGAAEYLYDEGNSSRAPYFWSQRNAMPYETTMWLLRDGLLDAADNHPVQPPFERMRSRLHSASRNAAAVAVVEEAKKSSLLSAAEGNGERDDEDDYDVASVREMLQHTRREHEKRKVALNERAQWKFKNNEPTARKHSPGMFDHMDDYIDDVAVSKQNAMKKAIMKTSKAARLKREQEEAESAKQQQSAVVAPWDAPSPRTIERKDRAKRAMERIAKEAAAAAAASKSKTKN